MPRLPLALAFSTLSLAACAAPPPQIGPRVRATLDDGQVIVGELATRRISLETGMGILDVEAADAGELGLVEGKNVDQSGNMIRLWLRNGSEFVGEWQKPDVAIAMTIGGQAIQLKAPIKKLERLQFAGDPMWPNEAVFRIKTRHGDDFFVDVTKTRLSFRNEMGAFSPYLSEIRHLEALDSARDSWRLYLMNGTVFKTRFDKEEVALQLAMGPELVRVPLSDITLMERQQLRYDVQAQMGFSETRASSLQRAPDEQAAAGATQALQEEDSAARQQRGPLDRLSSDGFYDNRAQKAAKSKARSLWKSPER